MLRILTSVLILSNCPALALAEAGAKSMFADEGTSVMMGDNGSETTATSAKPVASQPKAKTQSQTNGQPVSYVGLQYWIDLQKPNGSSLRVTTSYPFQSGDRIKLQIKSKTEGYLYVLNEDASRQQTPLYPAKGQPSGLILANQTYTIPTHGSIAFDDVPGQEKVTIALAKYPMPNSGPFHSALGSAAAYTGQTPYADCAGNGGVGSKGMYAEENSPSLDCMRSNHSAGSVGSKGMYAEEDTASAAPASYSVVPASALNDGQVLFVDFNLTHR